jgi:tetratricopeptide (TPR) repeat protein
MKMSDLKTISRKLRPALLAWPIALAGILSSPGAAGQRQNDPKQTALLPPYCKYTQDYREKMPGGNDPQQIARWANILGEKNFQHLHHYCYGLEHSNRALYFSRTKQERDRELAQSVKEFEYVIERVAPDFALLPEILTRRGENLLRLGNGPQGVMDLNRAIELKPDHWPPYAALSDYYKALGDIEAAREWAGRGLTAAPGTRALQRRLAELDKPKARPGPSAN